MKRCGLATLRGVLLVVVALTGCRSPRVKGVHEVHHLADLVTERIRIRLEAVGVGADLEARGEPLYETVVLPKFYARRVYSPAWVDGFGPTRLAEDLVISLAHADREGLRSEDYHLAAIESAIAAVRADGQKKTKTPALERWADLDLLLTDAFLEYGAHLLAGRANSETLQPEWLLYRRSADITALLDSALASGNVTSTFDKVIPIQNGYRRLRDALARYRGMAAMGGWPAIPDKPAMQRGDSGPAVAVLRERLRVEGDLPSDQQGDVFDSTLDVAVRKFQRRHGLEEDGAVKAATREALNVPLQRRVEQLELNLERWRWLPKDLGRRHIIVNIAAYQLEVVDETGVALAMRVVVGRPFDRTPIMSDTMRYLVLNPYWTVPTELAAGELLPKIQQSRSYLARNKLRVFPILGTDEVDPATINWSALSATNFRYRLRQDPGPLNSLGRIKFMFPNKYNVYMHDTPARPLFAQAQRDFSHGCIRLEKPMDLAVYLLRHNPRWTRDSLVSALDTAVDYSVRLPEPMPIHLLYWTAWADADGTIEFRRDIHERDPNLLKALRAPMTITPVTPAKVVTRPT